ncbi:MAG: SusC/RagA family TonB-linked outer membrane protein [Phaeodactylibacter sp.]|nr:SusC/RagA family TonB-linked outer membrane protein [Phaeodactylibacter sp.]MCB9048669.1 SusC/RagA family TonB-linked outer membrane protein [Lewinellaceae bacterium]
MKKRLLVLGLALFLGSALFAQRTITGVVTDQGGEALIGASVLLKGTSTGTVTDVDGNYQITVPDGSGNVLQFSYTGFGTQELEVGISNVINVALEEGAVLEEVVVTALGIEKDARSLGYSIDQVGSEELTKARESNIINSLQGKVTGVVINNTSGNLGASSKILIRGATSLSGRNNPLWVIDGQPVNDDQFNGGQANRISGTRDFANGASVLNPDDIENISILKGAAATALYGSRAAAGAIIVTTKRGKTKGTNNFQVSVNSSYRMDDLFVTPDYQQEYAMGSLAKYDSSSVGFDWGPRIVGQTVENVPITGGAGPLRAVDENGIRDFFETGNTWINNFAISDGNEKYDYRLSFGALNQTGVVPASELDRYNVSLNAGMRHSPMLSSRFGVQFIKTDSRGTAAAGANDVNIVGLDAFSSTLDQRLFKPWIDDAGNQINNPDPQINNPYWIRNENLNNRNDTRILANAALTFTPFENFELTGSFGYDYDQDNRFFSNRKGTITRLEGNFTTDNINNIQINTDIIAKYSFDITEDLSISALGGFNYNKRERTIEGLFGNQLLVPQLFSPGNVQQNVPNRDFREQVLFGLYSSVDLSYRDWLTLTITGRNDWSSTLPLENNSYFYPSVSAAFVFSDALGLTNDFFNYGKLRASFAQVGNDTDPYQLDFLFFPVTDATGQYSLNLNFPFNGASAYNKTNTIPPANLLPEQQTSYEFGAELDFFDYRLGLDIAYFNTQNKDQILALPVPQTTGFGFLRTNVGQVNTSGLEITLDATPLKFNKFSWNTAVNFSSAQVEVVELAEGVDRVLIASAFNSVQVVAEQGKGFELLGVPWLRDSVTGRPLINPIDGTRIAGEPKTFGSVLPDFTMGFVNSFRIGDFNLSFTIDWREGGVMKPSTVENLQTGGLVAETLLNREGTFIDRQGVIENADGTVRDNDVPVASAEHFWNALNDNSVAEPFIFDASFVKLREISLSYSFPQTLLGNSFVKNLVIGLEARNVALLYSVIPHIDPEASLFGAGADGWGIERSNVPSTRSIGVNLRATF